MRRIAIFISAVAGAVLVLGIVEALTNFRWSAGDQNPLFGNPKLLISDGATALFCGGFLALVAGAMWFVVRRNGQGDQ